jgi:ABC-type glycerol-3-phosphate transport system substrate-binding protein
MANSYGDVVVDLSAYIADESIGLGAEEIADFYPVFWEQDRIGDAHLGLAMQKTGQVIFYNASWARELGFENAPTTPEELREQACASAAANGNGTGGIFLNTNSSAIAGWIFAFGGEIENENGYNLNSPETEAAFTFLKTLQNEGCMWQPENFYPNAEFATRQGLFYISSLAGIQIQADYMKAAENEDEWTVIPFPGITGEPVINIYGPSLSILAATPEEQLASWLFIKYFLEIQNQAQWVETTGYFPSRQSTYRELGSYALENPQWQAASELLIYGQHEPRYESWGSVRGVLQDAAAELLYYGVGIDGIPQLLEELQNLASELHAETR